MQFPKKNYVLVGKVGHYSASEQNYKLTLMIHRHCYEEMLTALFFWVKLLLIKLSVFLTKLLVLVHLKNLDIPRAKFAIDSLSFYNATQMLNDTEVNYHKLACFFLISKSYIVIRFHLQ